MIIDSITKYIGNTPLLEIPQEVHGLQHIELYAKLELFNPWGSVKDRSAMGILGHHLGKLSSKRIIESSSGNMAKALQMIAGMQGSSLKTITNRIKVSEVRDILQLIGAQVQELPGKSDCYDPNDPNDPAVYIQQEIQKDPAGYLYSNQYFNDDNRRIHYETTGKEIADDLGTVDYVIGGLGTTGSTGGVAERLKETNPALISVGVVAENDDFIPGIRSRGETMEVGLFKQENYNKIVSVDSRDALEAMRALIVKTGLLAGPTTGASYAGALQYLQRIDKTFTQKKKAVFIACDRVEWYLSYIKERKPAWFGEEQKKRWQDSVKSLRAFDIPVARISEWIQQNNPLIVDVRQPISFKAAHIPNSVNMPFDYLDNMINTTNPFCTQGNILFVCPVGEKSALLATYVRKKNVEAFSLEGGITAWRDHDLPLERDL